MLKNKLNERADLIINIDDYDYLNYRFADLLDALRFKAVFFIETNKGEALIQIEELSKRGFEIGSHTHSHPADIKLLPGRILDEELQVSKHIIQDLTGKPCTALAYPRGRHNDYVIEAVKRAGYKEARTTHVLKTAVEGEFHQLRLPTTIHVFNDRKEYKGHSWLNMAKFYLADVVGNGGTFLLWGHAKEIVEKGEFNNFKIFLEEVAEYIKIYEYKLSQSI